MRQHTQGGATEAKVDEEGPKGEFSSDSQLRDGFSTGSLAPFPRLIVDYSATVEDVYSSLVQLVVCSTRRLDILSLCFRRSGQITRTWTVDLIGISLSHSTADQPNGLLAKYFAHYYCNELYHASKEKEATFSFHGGLSMLSVRGFRLADVFGHALIGTEEMPWHMLTWREGVNLTVSFLQDIEPDYRDATTAIWNVLLAETSFEVEDGHFETWTSWLNSSPAHNTDDADMEKLPHWSSIVHSQSEDRRFFISRSLDSDLLVLKGWKTMREGDVICIVFGCSVPLVLRPVGDYFTLVGDCYVHGFMQGEAIALLESGKVVEETFDLR